MKRADATEAAGIVNRMLESLAGTIPTQGRAGSDARTAIGDTRANAITLLIGDVIGHALDECFDLARTAGATLAGIERVRFVLDEEMPQSLGATLVRNASIGFCLATEGRIIADTTFTSRQDVEQIREAMVEPFAYAENIAADAMDSMSYQALVRLHAAITNHLIETARPLPRMLNYQFFAALPTLVMAHKLYIDAGRADEMRKENKIVHPAFSPMIGQGLSA